MKQISVESLGQPIAGTENLYPWGEDQIVKFFGHDAPPGWVEKLGQTERRLHDLGLPVPEVGDIIESREGLGQVYERIAGGTLADALLGADLPRDEIVRLAHVFAEVQARIHACGGIPDLPSQWELLSAVIRGITALPPDIREATVDVLQELPDGDRLCHGDFHPYNVLMGPRGPVVIDWNNAHIGNPLEDVARSALMLSGLGVSEPPRRTVMDRFTASYLERYFELRPGDQGQVTAWQSVVAAVRLHDNVPELQSWLLEKVKTGLAWSD